VIPENIHTMPQAASWNSKGVGGLLDWNSEGMGGGGGGEGGGEDGKSLA